MIHHTESLRAAVRDLIAGRPTMPGVNATRETGGGSCANCDEEFAVARIEWGIPRRGLRFCRPCGIRLMRQLSYALDDDRSAGGETAADRYERENRARADRLRPNDSWR
jgi:hypothetical protein